MDKQEQDLYLAFLCARLDVRLVQLSDYVVANDADIVSTARTGSVAAYLSLVLNCLAISLLTSSLFSGIIHLVSWPQEIFVAAYLQPLMTSHLTFFHFYVFLYVRSHHTKLLKRLVRYC